MQVKKKVFIKRLAEMDKVDKGQVVYWTGGQGTGCLLDKGQVVYRVARQRYDKDRCYYHLFNRVVGESGWFPFGKVEKEAMFRIMDHLNKLYTIEIVSFVCMSNHFPAVVSAPAEMPGVEEVGRRFRAYYGKDRLPPDWRIKENYEKYAHRMRDVSALMKDFQQHCTNWYNRSGPQKRRGTLWADRFKSVILESGRAVWECVQYDGGLLRGTAGRQKNVRRLDVEGSVSESLFLA